GGGGGPTGSARARRGHRLRISGSGDGGRRGGGAGRRAGARAANRHGGAHLTMAARVTLEHPVDVVVVGGGNAALCGALAARETGARVLLLEKAPRHERGGNSFFTAGGFRFAHAGLDDLRKDVLVDVTDEEAETLDVPPY